jgi:hypothetical protein
LKTFLDSGVLLHAWRGATFSGVAMQIIDDDRREFFSAQMVRLELLPKAQFEKRRKEDLGSEAEELAARYGLAGPDALQLAAAIRQGVEEFYTSEKPGKPMFRVKETKVISLFSLLN